MSFPILRRAALYVRVSASDQTTGNQERELNAIAARMGCTSHRSKSDLRLNCVAIQGHSTSRGYGTPSNRAFPAFPDRRADRALRSQGCL